ncbi:uncharacterized protein AB675_10553 [Cyphellophora attinorum]|uniref:Uncharacterized protein n=1 Tax=Cyphellophora attinorum TaxID=1664694 RepID=A0A0N1P1H8_9EURO|nr:uncharacterized protein AB675_10553 [Phialophora attinorum]KPI40702.1 hypothetical protein AB675_10553 [Phialophora attinorum]
MNGVQSKRKTSLDPENDKENQEPSEVERIMAPLRANKSSLPVAATYNSPRDRVSSGVADVDDLPSDDEMEELFNAADCDWGVNESTVRVDDESMADLEANITQQAPQSHVSLRDVQRYPDEELLGTGQSTSPTTQRETQTIDKANSSVQLDDDDTYIESTANENLSSGKHNDLPASEKLFKYVPSTCTHENETAEEKKLCLFEDDQRRKWDGFPLAMYEEFHRCAVIIDG